MKVEAAAGYRRYSGEHPRMHRAKCLCVSDIIFARLPHVRFEPNRLWMRPREDGCKHTAAVARTKLIYTYINTYKCKWHRCSAHVEFAPTKCMLPRAENAYYRIPRPEVDSRLCIVHVCQRNQRYTNNRDARDERLVRCCYSSCEQKFQ